jgi:hypothetical protein
MTRPGAATRRPRLGTTVLVLLLAVAGFGLDPSSGNLTRSVDLASHAYEQLALPLGPVRLTGVDGLTTWTAAHFRTSFAAIVPSTAGAIALVRAGRARLPGATRSTEATGARARLRGPPSSSASYIPA